MKKPSTLAGKENGKLPDSILVSIGIGNARMERTAARSFLAMFDEARKAGFVIRQVGHYRTFQEQVNLFVSRYEPVSKITFDQTPRDRRKVWEKAPQNGYNSVYWVKKRINGRYPATAASPGNSNHGLGLALDIAEEYDSDPQPDPIRDSFVRWLISNAGRYGISAELQSEPWHWRYVAGDAIPLATQLYESAHGGSPPVPTPQPPVTPGPSIVIAYPGTPLQRGSKGEAVKLVQAKVGAKPDGDFGKATDRRVKDWQKKNKLKADGIVGPVTWKKMFG
jgi:peptidoglycan hydrolase-like protein with peptidoglycan-binding domain